MAVKSPPPAIRLTPSPLIAAEHLSANVFEASFKLDYSKNVAGTVGTILIHKIARKSEELLRTPSTCDTEETPCKQIDIILQDKDPLSKEKLIRICNLVVKCLNGAWGSEVNSLMNRNVKIILENNLVYTGINVFDLDITKFTESQYITAKSIKDDEVSVGKVPHFELEDDFTNLFNETLSKYITVHIHDPKV